MALVAGGSCAISRKLPGMRVLVASLTLFWRSAEVHIPHAELKVGRLVAVRAGRGLVRSGEREGSLSMIEPCQVFPVFDVVAGFATSRATAGPSLCHALRELAAMRIGVAGGACQISEMIGHRRVRVLTPRGVAVNAGHGHVGVEQREPRLSVAGEREC